MRLPNGYGQVCKLAGNRRRPYMVHKTVGYTHTGRALYHTIGYYVTKSEALTALALFNNAPTTPAPCITLGGIYKAWYPMHVKSVSPATAASYANSLQHLGKVAAMPISTIKHHHLQAVLDAMTDAGLSYASRKKVRSLLHQLYVYADINDLTERNIAAHLNIGKNTPVYPHKPFTRAQVNKLWASGHPDADIPLIMLYTGMRSAELRQLKRSDVKVRQKYIDITQSKTKAGIRIIPIHPRIWPLIERRLAGNTKYLLSADLLSYAQLAGRFKSVMQAIKCKHTTHDCRHTFATWLDDADANYNAKRRLLGHAANNVTDGVYTHKALQQLRAAIKLLK